MNRQAISNISPREVDRIDSGTIWTRQFTGLFFGQLLMAVGFSITVPIIPFSALKFGASSETVVYIMGSNLIALVLLSGLFGYLSDRIGRLPVIMTAYVVSILSFYLLVISNSPSELLIGRALGGIHGAAGGVVMALVGDNVSKSRAATAMATLSSTIKLGFIAGLIGLYFAAPSSDKDYQALFVVALSCSLLAFFSLGIGAWNSWKVQSPLPSSVAALQGEDEQAVAPLRFTTLPGILPRTSVICFIGALVAYSIYSAQNATLALVLSERFHIQPSQISLVLALGNTAAVILQVFGTSRISRLRNLEGFMWTSAGCIACTAAASTIDSSPIYLVAHYLLVTVLSATTYPIAMAHLGNARSNVDRGVLLAGATNILTVFQAATPLLFGLVVTLLGISYVGFVEAGVILIVLTVGFFLAARFWPANTSKTKV
ncbi:MFS transporter [Allorhizobium undicola]|uniref:MFS transporter n=1 Tax=Allorhizobium undicola TaxID=78527 RepID=UPI0004861B7D|nr:MFS transporter [Allorhizobium undicola]